MNRRLRTARPPFQVYESSAHGGVRGPSFMNHPYAISVVEPPHKTYVMERGCDSAKIKMVTCGYCLMYVRVRP